MRLPINPTKKPEECALYIQDIANINDRESVAIPSGISSRYYYDGTEQTATVTGYDDEKMSITGNTGTLPGDYSATVGLLVGSYKWSDGGTWNLSYPWTIRKALNTLKLSESAVVLTESDPTVTVTATIGYGALSASIDSSEIATVVLSGNDISITLKSGVSSGSAFVTVSLDGGSFYESAEARIPVYVGSAPIYGAIWAGGASTAWTRTDDAESFEDPVAAVANGTGSSPFDDIYPWCEMKKVEDAGGTLVSIPKFYYKWTLSGSSVKLQISAASFTGASISPAHADRSDGCGERNVVYVGRYLGDSSYQSRNNKQVAASRSIARTNIHAIGDEYWQQDTSIYWTIRMLYLVEYCSWLTSGKIGGSNSINGGTDEMQYHTGTAGSSLTASARTQYRNIEEIGTGMIDGQYVSSTSFYIIKNPNNFSDSKSGGSLAGTIPSASYSSWIYKFKKANAVADYMLLPANVSNTSSYSAYTGQYYEYLSTSVFMRVYSVAQLFSWTYAKNTAVYDYFRLMKLPN